jgi:hypothetical protein
VSLRVDNGFAPFLSSDFVPVRPNVATTTYPLSGDSDADGDTLSLVSVTQPGHGTATKQGDTVVYTPTAGFTGSDFFFYTATDGTHQSTASVSLDVATSTPPFVSSDTAFTKPGQAVATYPLSGDTDSEGDTLSVTGITQPANGTASLAGDVVTYTPNAGFTGTDTYNYTATDGSTSRTATVTIFVDTSTGPSPVDESVETVAGHPIKTYPLSQDFDPDGDTLSLTGVTQPSNGTVSLAGSVATYTPNAGFTGGDSFDYTVTDGIHTATGTVFVSIS